MSGTKEKSAALRWAVYAAVIIVAAASFFTIRFLTSAGMFTSFREEITADCSTIEAVPGPEDIVIDRERALAFVSAVDRRKIAAGGPGSQAIRGGIYVIDLSEASDAWALRPVTALEPADFRPHGIDLYVSEEGQRFLFVVNHPSDGTHDVEIFEVLEGGLLEHRRTVSSELFIHPNDVHAVGPDAFYLTNDHGSSSNFGRLLEDFFLADRGNLVYWEGDEGRVVADGFTYANGVNSSPDGTKLYVAETLDMTLRIFTRDIETGALEPFETVYLGTGVDNIDVQEDGRLLIGAHPSLTDFLAHANDPAELSPSQIVEMTPRAGGGGEARTLLLDKGDLLSGLATAAGYNGLMLASGVFEPKILVCAQESAAEETE